MEDVPILNIMHRIKSHPKYPGTFRRYKPIDEV
jgi:hypothetical protein